jgi:sulfate transport system permease protein
MARRRHPRIIPGFGLSLGYSVTYLTLIILIPLAALILKSSTQGWGQLWGTLKQEPVHTAFYNTFLSALIAALLNVPLGLLVAWVLVRYRFVGRRLLDALIDLPFALPTAVAGLSLAFLYGPRGFVGQALTKVGFGFYWPIWAPAEGKFWPLQLKWYETIGLSPLGITAALLFVGMPFVVRTLQPILEDMDVQVEEAAASLGATRLQTFWRVLLPQLMPSIITGFALAFARGIGEYGSVLFIAGQQPETIIVPRLIIERLEQWDIPASATVATLLLMASFVMLLVINLVQRRVNRWGEGGAEL